MKKILVGATLIALLAVPMIVVGAQQASVAVLNGTPEPEGEGNACEEGDITVERSEWVCTWEDTSFEYEATFYEAVFEKQCPEGYRATGEFPDGDHACRATIDGEQVWTAAIDVEIEPEYYNCPDGGELDGETCFVEQGEWVCAWTEPVCRTPDLPLVTLCHARPPDTAAQGWGEITISREGVFSQGHASEHDADIIPPFGDFAGKNWPRGQEILENGCVRPEPTPIPPVQPTVAIGGICTEDGDSQEIGYNFSDGDFDGARLIITRSDGVEVANAGDSGGSRVFFAARAADYSWEVWSLGGESLPRELLAFGDFTVLKCDLPDDPTPTPTPDDPPEHPPTGADPNTILPAVMSLGGFALMGIGGSILFMRRRGNNQ